MAEDYLKPPFTYNQQLEQLKKRGLTVENEAKALHLLESVSYYRLSGYWYPMLKAPKCDHIFKEGSSFNNSFALYCFDRELRQLILSQIEKIEVAIRAKLIYFLSHKYGPFWYSDPANFSKPDVHIKTMKTINEEFANADELFIEQFKQKYNDPLPPSWMMLETAEDNHPAQALYERNGWERVKDELFYRVDL